MKKKIFIFLIIISILLSFSFVYAKEPDLIKRLNSGLTTIKSWIVKISTPAAAVAVGTGVLMKKFSFGDEERIVVGKKLIKSALFSYAFILAIDLILTAITMIVDGKAS